MRVTSLAGLASALLLGSNFLGQVCAAPSPDPKNSWVRSSRWRKGRPNLARDVNKRAAPEVQTGAMPVNAPFDNVWAPLSDPETASVISYLFAQKELNLTVSEKAGQWANTIVLVENLPPNKTSVLEYFEDKARVPTKYAHVVLDVRATEEPYYADLLVGPLPVKNSSTTWSPLEFPFTRKTQGRVRNPLADEEILYGAYFSGIGSSVADITTDLWGGKATGADNDTLSIGGIDPVYQEDGKIEMWCGFSSVPTSSYDDSTLLPLGLYFKVDITGRDPSKWKVEGWYINNEFYETVDDLRAAHKKGAFKGLGANVDGIWAQTGQSGPKLRDDNKEPPISVAPAGSRYGVDEAQRYVEWMDFSFYISYSRDLGVALYDIRYKGQRILYELGLQEAAAHYAGSDPVQSGTAYLDSYYGFGDYNFELVKGYDCPAYATYLNTSFYKEESTHTHLDSICLFEYTADYPLQRHSASDYVSASKNTYFTVRSVSTVGNYDYMFTYTFHLDGTIGVEVRASGYIQAAYFAANQDYGFQVHDFLSGSMHDHVLNFKADFDILGTDNSVEVTDQVPASVVYPWSNGKPRNTMKLERHFIKDEDESRFNWGPNSCNMVRVVNTDKPNKYGELRGYRLMPMTTPTHLTVENSSNLVDAANWASYDVQITKAHDYEPRGAHPYNNQDVNNPVINFDNFFNGESLNQTDLVFWLNMGMHHVPHTGDLPNTVFTTAHVGVQFVPFNYLEGDPSRQTVNQIQINYQNGSATGYNTYEQGSAATALDYTPLQPDYMDYKGDVIVRKFPYDPNKWYEENPDEA